MTTTFHFVLSTAHIGPFPSNIRLNAVEVAVFDAEGKYLETLSLAIHHPLVVESIRLDRDNWAIDYRVEFEWMRRYEVTPEQVEIKVLELARKYEQLTLDSSDGAKSVLSQEVYNEIRWVTWSGGSSNASFLSLFSPEVRRRCNMNEPCLIAPLFRSCMNKLKCKDEELDGILGRSKDEWTDFPEAENHGRFWNRSGIGSRRFAGGQHPQSHEV